MNPPVVRAWFGYLFIGILVFSIYRREVDMNLKILEQVFLGNRILDYSIALLSLSLSLLFVKVVIRFFIRRLKKLAERTTATFGNFSIKILEISYIKK